MGNRSDSAVSTADLTMDELRLFIALRALESGDGDPGALLTLQKEVERLEAALAADGIEPFRFGQEDLDNLFLLKRRQSLDPEDKVKRIAPLRWVYAIARKLFFGTQRKYNESASYLIRRLYASALLTRYYQLRSLMLERRLRDVEERIARIEGLK